jgi:FlaA1/EpsC-like NDP-sugar epimerase
MSEELLNRYSNKFVSRWLILLIDAFIASSAFLFAYLLRYNFSVTSIDWSIAKFQLVFLLYVRLGCFFYFRTYIGIIRHTSIEDAIMIFKAVLVSTLIIGVTSYFLGYSGSQASPYYLPFSIIIIDFFICLFSLVVSRFFVKLVYEILQKDIKSPIGIFIYGAGYSGILTKKVLQNDKFRHYNILGFIDDNEALQNKTVEGVRVMSLNEALIKIEKSDEGIEVIVGINKISSSRKRKISDVFLEKGIIVKTLPPVDKWVDGEFVVNQIDKVKIEDLLSRDAISIDNQQISENLAGKIILITGAAGSIGSEIARQVLRYFPTKVILLDQAESALYDLEFELNRAIPNNVGMSVVIADVTDRTRLRRVFKTHRPHIVFHAAAYKHVPLMENNPYEAIRVNVLGSQNVADFSAEFSVDKFVMVSTDKAVNPTNVMGATKRLAEMYTQSMNEINGIKTKFIATRFGNVLGSNGSVIPLFKKQIEAGGPLTVTHPNVTRYFMTIPEACQLVLEAATMGHGGEVFVFDMGEPVKIVDLAHKMITLAGLRIEKDIEVKYTGLRPGEKLYEELLTNNENTLPTHHEKIMRAKVITPTYSQMELHLEQISQILEVGTNKELVAKVKEIIPEYVSNNSVYEELDKPKGFK